MKLTPLERDLIAMIGPKVDSMGYDLLWLELKSGVLSVFCENPQTGRITLDECGAISRAISPMLEETDPIPGAYRLEVSSAGIDRPLFKPSDFERFKGLEAKIELGETVQTETGQRRFKGILEGMGEDGHVLIACPDIGTVSLPIDSIHKARLVMSDALIKATKPKENEVNA